MPKLPTPKRQPTNWDSPALLPAKAVPAKAASPVPTPKPPNLSRRRFVRGLLGSGAAALALGGLGVAQGYGLGISRLTRRLPGLQKPLTMAFLTDLHYGLYIGAGNVRRWIDAANALKPDLVLFGGDQLDGSMNHLPPELLSELARLRAPLGVYGVWGNHDHGVFANVSQQTGQPWQVVQEQLVQQFARAGLTILNNQGRALRQDFFLGGVDDFKRGFVDTRAALAEAGQQSTLLLSHNPDILPVLQARPGLVLCGHTHGGQVRLPLLGAPVVPSRYGQKYAMGWVTGAANTPAYVSRGLGMSGIPFRNLCEPELVFLTLLP